MYYVLQPGTYEPIGKESLVQADTVAKEQALESVVYLSDKFTITPQFVIEGGIRFSVYNYLGPQSVNQYPPDVPKSPDNVVDVKTYGPGQLIKTYSEYTRIYIE